MNKPRSSLLAIVAFIGIIGVSNGTFARDPWEGLWATSAKECLDPEGPNRNTYIDTKFRDRDKIKSLFDQYEHHCKIDDMITSGLKISLTMTCYEMWENFQNEQEGFPETAQIEFIKYGSIRINGEQYDRCRITRNIY